MRRDVRNLGSAWPIYRIDEGGRSVRLGELRALHGGFRMALEASELSNWLETPYPDHLCSGMPFLLQEGRPQGYIGRTIARRVGSILGVPEDPGTWSDDDLLAYLLAEGDDLSGDLILGDRALERALRRMMETEVGAIRLEDRAAIYPKLAEAAQRGDNNGASAGGEQPKFLATTRRQEGLTSVLVKFSSAEFSPARRRWGDLLLCEHVASDLLRARGIPAARTEVLDSGGRRFLEVERFDRVRGMGRRGLLSLGSLEDAVPGALGTDWCAASVALERAGCLAPEQASRLRWLWCFGDMIGNSDMHRGNVSVILGGPPFTIAPSYDMLPMLHAPGAQGDLTLRAFSPRPPMPLASDVWPDAAQAASEFWGRVVSDEAISPEYRLLAEDCGRQVSALRAQFE
jgi:hypothetical protein